MRLISEDGFDLEILVEAEDPYSRPLPDCR
jgi:hypothetical protein